MSSLECDTAGAASVVVIASAAASSPESQAYFMVNILKMHQLDTQYLGRKTVPAERKNNLIDFS